MSEISELERDIEETRARLDRTIDRIQDKMTVSGVVDDVLGTARRSGYASAVDRAAAAVRENPIPVLLVAAGLGWLAYSMSESARRRDLRLLARRDLDERLGPRPPVRHLGEGGAIADRDIDPAAASRPTDPDLGVAEGAPLHGRPSLTPRADADAPASTYAMGAPAGPRR